MFKTEESVHYSFSGLGLSGDKRSINGCWLEVKSLRWGPVEPGLTEEQTPLLGLQDTKEL